MPAWMPHRDAASMKISSKRAGPATGASSASPPVLASDRSATSAGRIAAASADGRVVTASIVASVAMAASLPPLGVDVHTHGPYTPAPVQLWAPVRPSVHAHGVEAPGTHRSAAASVRCDGTGPPPPQPPSNQTNTTAHGPICLAPICAFALTPWLLRPYSTSRLAARRSVRSRNGGNSRRRRRDGTECSMTA
jgi:hypothetical protein